MKEKFKKLRDTAVHEAVLAKAYLAALIQKKETTEEERGKLVEQPKIKEMFLDFGKSMRALYFRVLEGSLAKRFRDARVSDDFTKLMEAGEDASTGEVESVWQKVLSKVNPNDAVTEWLKSKVMRDGVIKHPEFLNTAREYAVSHLRYLFTRRLNNEPIQDEVEKEETEEKTD